MNLCNLIGIDNFRDIMFFNTRKLITPFVNKGFHKCEIKKTQNQILFFILMHILAYFIQKSLYIIFFIERRGDEE